MMFFYQCGICKCPLDPGEGRICGDCRAEGERRKARDAAMGLLLVSCAEQKFTQMEMEDFLNA